MTYSASYREYVVCAYCVIRNTMETAVSTILGVITESVSQPFKPLGTKTIPIKSLFVWKLFGMLLARPF